MQHYAEWIAVDWGTSNLRVWMMGADGRPFAADRSDKGMAGLTQDGFEPALLSLIDPYLNPDHVTPVICAGMVGAREGWREAAYVATPCAPPDARAAVAVQAHDPRIAVHILPGVKQMAAPDVMRGEETQIAGVLHSQPEFDGILCLPGTHTKWVHISAGEIVSFQTCMTGEIFALLASQSVLRHSVTTEEWDEDSFIDGVTQAMDSPQSFASRLFGLRAGGLLQGTPAGAARARLSGLLVGLELAGTRPYWLGQQVAVIGAGDAARPYVAALEAQGVPVTQTDETRMVLAGLTAAWRRIGGAK